ncbi:hypothetical protein F4808DRAFT_259016 [Astrocystis sublimbata]|nr:hypothetical protein F4808DRAFT_259016 [Astrocystis sublimbata]
MAEPSINKPRRGRAAHAPRRPSDGRLRTQKGLCLQHIPTFRFHYHPGSEMEEMEMVLRPDRIRPLTQAAFCDTPKPKIFVLYGPDSGIGKTKLAARFARKAQNAFQSIFWLDATSKSTLTRSIAKCGATIQGESPVKELCQNYLDDGAANPDIVVAEFKKWLVSLQHSEWLMVFDRARMDEGRSDSDDSYELRKYLPRNPGAILITTCTPLWALEDTMELRGALNLDEGRSLFYEVYGLERNMCKTSNLSVLYSTINSGLCSFLTSFRTGNRTLNEILCRLDAHPLAIELCAAYLRETGCPLAEYLTKIDSQLAYLEKVENRHYRTFDNVAAALMLSLNQIWESNLAAGKLFYLWAFVTRARFLGLGIDFNLANNSLGHKRVHVLLKPLLQAGGIPSIYAPSGSP